MISRQFDKRRTGEGAVKGWETRKRKQADRRAALNRLIDVVDDITSDLVVGERTPASDKYVIGALTLIRWRDSIAAAVRVLTLFAFVLCLASAASAQTLDMRADKVAAGLTGWDGGEIDADGDDTTPEWILLSREGFGWYRVVILVGPAMCYGPKHGLNPAPWYQLPARGWEWFRAHLEDVRGRHRLVLQSDYSYYRLYLDRPDGNCSFTP